MEDFNEVSIPIYSNKGAYALLLGAGVSRGTGVPTGYEIEKDLIGKIAAVSNVDIGQHEPHEWYKDKYGKEATYTSLLDEVVKTPTERVQLMKNYFEPTEEERYNGLKLPTKTHKAIAKLIKAGYIRVVITTNFDRFLEQALRDENIEVTVITGQEDIDRALPLMHSGPIIVKVNGDYQSCKFLNTTEELKNYPRKMNDYLKRIFEDFGLITCGWSARWDKALIEILRKSPKSRYTSFFTYVNELEDDLSTASKYRNGINIRINSADEFFSEVYERVVAMENLYNKKDIDKDVFVARIKRYICKPEYKVELDELIESELNRACNVINENETYDFKYNEENFPDIFSNYFSKHLGAVDKMIPAAIAIVRWGTNECQNELVKVIQKLCILRIPKKSTRSSAEYFHLIAAQLLVHSIGVACIYYEKYSLLIKLIKTKTLQDYPFCRSDNLFYSASFGIYEDAIRYHKERLISDIIVDNLFQYYRDVFFSKKEFESCYYTWEYMQSLIIKYYKLDGTSNFIEGKYKDLFRNISYHSDYFANYVSSSIEEKENWEPLKQGLFDGKYLEYNDLYVALKKSV